MSIKENLILKIKRHFENISSVYYNFVDRCWYSQGYCHRQELKFVLHNLPQDKSYLILDAGSGPGRHTAHLAKKGHRVVAFDLAFNMLKETRISIMKENISTPVNCVNGDVRRLCFKDNSFDAIINMEVLEHLPDYLEDTKIALQEFCRVLKRKGMLITEAPLKLHYCLSKISLLYPWNWFKKKLTREGVSVEENKEYYLKNPLYIDNLFWKSDIERIFKNNRLRIYKKSYIQILQSGYHKRIPKVSYLEHYLEKVPLLKECAKEIVWRLQKNGN